jgi:hypothetical protein
LEREEKPDEPLLTLIAQFLEVRRRSQLRHSFVRTVRSDIDHSDALAAALN